MSPLPSEEELLTRLKAVFSTRRRDVLLGIGDDAAVVLDGGRLVVTTDVLVEGEDFLADTDPGRLGRKTLSVSLSDLAAMGATPLYATLTLGLRRESEASWVEQFAQGLKSVAVEHGVAVVGGDLSASPVIFASVTALGRAPDSGAITRSGARAGDEIYVSGTLGASAAGLALLRLGYRLGPDGAGSRVRGKRPVGSKVPEMARLLRHHVDPRPLVELGRALADPSLASAAIDMSDGLARDLHRLCRSSGVGANLEAEALPVDSALHDLESLTRLDPDEAALFGGEDFGLLFTVDPGKAKSLARLTRRFALRRIGTVTDARSGVKIVTGGRADPLPDTGFDHFGKQGSCP